MRVRSALAAAILTIGTGTVASAQTALDRVDPTASNRTPIPAEPRAPPPPPSVAIAPPPASDSAASGTVSVGAIALVGLKALPPSAFADIIERHVGRTLAPAELSALAGEIATRARSRGYVFASACIEPQRVAAGILTITVDEGRVDAIRLTGDQNPAVRRALDPLTDGVPVTLAMVERRLLVAGDVDGVRVGGGRFAREGGKGVLTVDVVRLPTHVRLTLANEGTHAVGPVQARVDVDMAAILFDDDALSVTYLGVPFQPRELAYLRAQYAKRVSASGTELGVYGSYSRAEPGADLAYLDLKSRSWAAGVTLRQPLLRRRAASIWADADLGLRDTVLRSPNGLLRHDRIVTARAGLYGYRGWLGGRLRANAGVVRGLGILGATQAGDPLASRSDADGTFTAFSAGADWTRTLGGRFSTRLAIQAQVATDPLLSAEEFGLGGTSFLRAYSYSERSGDRGAMAMGELRYDIDDPFGAMRHAQLYAYADGGRVTNLADGYGGGALASAGGGLRADVTRSIDARVEVAVPLTARRYDTGTKEPRVNLRLVKSLG